MPRCVPPIVPFALPSAGEREALRLAARYLMRAGTAAATRLFDCAPDDARAELFAAYSDSLLHSAALCDGLTRSLTDFVHAVELDGIARRLP